MPVSFDILMFNLEDDGYVFLLSKYQIHFRNSIPFEYSVQLRNIFMLYNIYKNGAALHYTLFIIHACDLLFARVSFAL